MNRRTWLGAAGASLLGSSAQGQHGGRAPDTPSRTKAVVPFPHDGQRPRYHFMAPANWMNDPNGLIFYRDEYHVFYQHNPGASVWGNMHWGHAVSKNLLEWEHLPIALAPTPGGYDKDGVFSGCMVVHKDVPTILYTGTQPEVQAIATSNHPRLEAWTKWEGNPVIASAPQGLETTGFRDPFVWRENGEWLMAVGSGLKGKGGAVLLYRSADLRQWEYLHPLAESADAALGTMWECPNFFPLGNKHVLLISPIPLRKALYAVGTYAGRRFQIEKIGSLDDGGHFYAPQVFLDGANRRVMFGWSWEGRSKEAQVAAGWAGALTLPRVLSLDRDGQLRMEPHPFCSRLVRFARAVKSAAPGDALRREISAAGIRGNSGRLDAIIDPGDSRELGIAFYVSDDGREQTRLVWNREPGELVIDRSRSSLSGSQDAREYRAPLTLARKEVLQLTLYLDRSLIEVYANGRCCLTTRVYPERSDSVGIDVFASGKRTVVRELVWRPISLQAG